MRIAAPEDGRVVADPLPREVRRFINKHLHGFSQLELLLHLHDNPSEPVTAAMAARELRLGEEQVAALLQDLHTSGLLATRGSGGQRESYRYEPRTRELARQVDALAGIDPTYRHRIVQLIFSKPPDSLTNFAQAFRLRKDEDG
jgi:hypothetical protein